MSTAHATPSTQPIIYPDSDGEPIAENTLQFDWIMTIKGGLDALFKDDPNVFVAGDLLWYPVEGDNKTRTAPDAMVVFGRPKGYRGSYMQWQEADIAPQVVFEVLSPGIRSGEMGRKLEFYETFGVEEYYQYDPEREPRAGTRSPLRGWIRDEDRLVEVLKMPGFESPRLGIRFELGEGKDALTIYHPDGQPFIGFVEQFDKAEAERHRADQQEARAGEAQLRADEAQLRADEAQLKAGEAQLRAEAVRRRADEQAARADALMAQLRAMGIDAEE